MTTCVAAIIEGKTIVGCDTLLSTVNSKVVVPNFTKLFRFNNFIVGCAGTSTIFHIVDKYYKGHYKKWGGRNKPAPKNQHECYAMFKPVFKTYSNSIKDMLTYSKADEDGVLLLVATSNSIYVVSEYSAEPYKTFAAIGSGEAWALGALHATYPNKNCVELALKAACTYDKNSGEPTIVEIL